MPDGLLPLVAAGFLVGLVVVGEGVLGDLAEEEEEEEGEGVCGCCCCCCCCWVVGSGLR